MVKYKKVGFLCLFILAVVICVVGFWKSLPQNNPSEKYSILNWQYGRPKKTQYENEESLELVLAELFISWQGFQNTLMPDTDSVENFQNSLYLKTLVNFFSARESTALTQQQIQKALGQPNIYFYDKSIYQDGQQWHMRVIYYPVNIYVLAITDQMPLQNKWCFIQYWNEDEFYFDTIFDSDIYDVEDFILFEKEDRVYAALWGYCYRQLPLTPYIRVFEVGSEGIAPASFFSNSWLQNEMLYIDTELFFSHNHYGGWVFFTDGSLLMANRKCGMNQQGRWPSDFLKLEIELEAADLQFRWTAKSWDDTIEGELALNLIEETIN